VQKNYHHPFGDGLCTHSAVLAYGAVQAPPLIGMEWTIIPAGLDCSPNSIRRKQYFSPEVQ